MFHRGRLSRLCAALVLAAFLPVAGGGCFGKFQLTRNLYGYNKDFDQNKWVQWLAFLVAAIIPVYAGAILVDAIVANSLEFWTDDNPIAPRHVPRRFTDASSGQSVEMTLLPDGRIEARISSPDGSARRLFLERGPDAISARDEEGRLLARVGEGAR
jgi:hypothetical protein